LRILAHTFVSVQQSLSAVLFLFAGAADGTKQPMPCTIVQGSDAGPFRGTYIRVRTASSVRRA
jgi:hypothetical protein